MKRLALVFVIFMIAVPALMADFQEVLTQADRLHKQEAHGELRSFLEASLSQAADNKEKAELYWRLARAWLHLGDQAEDRGATGQQLLAFFAKGEELAQKAIDLDPGNHLGYYWKSANSGRWGQVKGILNALFKAKPMRDLLRKAVSLKPDHAESYYVLGQLYEQVPGVPISFGDKDFAVSLGRKAVDLKAEQVTAGMEEKLDYDFYTELAKHLWERNWSAARRLKEQDKKSALYKSKIDPMEKNLYYEGVVTLQKASDREEALELIAWTVKQMEGLASRDRSQEDDLKEARETLAGWKK